MGKRKTQRLAFWGEYVSPDTEISEEVYRARLELMKIVKQVFPNFLKKLSSDVFPLYEQLAKGGYDFDQILWTNSSPYALLTEDGGLKAALLNWAAQFNAEAEWLMDGALRTLRGWHVAPDWRESLSWNTQHGRSETFLRGEAFEFRYQGWEVLLLTWPAYSESLRRRFEEKLFEHERKTRELAESKGLVRARRTYSTVNFEWFVLYQFAGLSSPEIVKRLAKGNSHTDPSTVLKGVKTAARLIDWGSLRSSEAKRRVASIPRS